MKVVFERIDGKMRPETEEERLEERPLTIVMVMPAPPLRFPPLLPIATDIPRAKKASDIPAAKK